MKMKITPELREAAEKYSDQKECTCDPNSFGYGGVCPYRDDAHDFIRGAEYQDPIAYERGRMEERENMLELMKETRFISCTGEFQVEWLKEWLASLDARPGETSGEGK